MTKTEDQKPKPTDAAAIILAAGQSQRMGAFKPLLPFGPKTVIETAIDNMRGGGIEKVVVVVGVGPRADELKAHLQESNITFAVNPDPNSEMSSSIACGVRAVSEGTRAVVINPVDHAAVPGKIIALLINEWQQGAQLVKPSWKQQGGHPVLIDLTFRKELLKLDPDSGLKALFNQHQDQLRRVVVQSNLIARDMDTWDDYLALHLEVWRSAIGNARRQARLEQAWVENKLIRMTN